jgi:hypothetical protein
VKGACLVTWFGGLLCVCVICLFAFEAFVVENLPAPSFILVFTIFCVIIVSFLGFFSHSFLPQFFR